MTNGYQMDSLWLWGVPCLSGVAVFLMDRQLFYVLAEQQAPLWVCAFALAWSTAELLFYCFAYRILYPKGAWFVYEKKLTFNPGAKRWFLPLYLALWSFTAVAAGITWYYGQPGILAVAAVQLGMILWVWIRLR